MHLISIIFTARRCAKRGLCCRPVSPCLSVSHVLLLYPDGWRYRQTKLLSRSGSYIILVFQPQSLLSISKGNTFSGSVKYTGVEKFAIFNWNRRLFRKWHEISPRLLWNVNRKVADRSVSVPVTLSDHESRNAKGYFFQADLLNARTV